MGIDFSDGMITRGKRQDERNLSRYEKFKEIYGVYGVFELPEGAVCRHHDEEWIRQLLRDFSQLDYSYVTRTTMNGHKSNGFYFLEKKL